MTTTNQEHPKKPVHAHRLKKAKDREAAMHAEVMQRLQTPTKGKGINEKTYTMRRQFLDREEARRVYEDALPTFIRQTDAMCARVAEQWENGRLYAKAFSMGKTENDPSLLFRHTTDILSIHMKNVSLSDFMVLYAAYEKELDDYVRAEYGFDCLYEYMKPAIDSFEDMPEPVLSASTGAGLHAVIQKLAGGGDGAIDIEEEAEKALAYKDYERNVVSIGMRIMCEYVITCAGVYERIFGHTVPYVAPFNKKTFTSFKEACKAEQEALPDNKRQKVVGIIKSLLAERDAALSDTDTHAD